MKANFRIEDRREVTQGSLGEKDGRWGVYFATVALFSVVSPAGCYSEKIQLVPHPLFSSVSSPLCLGLPENIQHRLLRVPQPLEGFLACPKRESPTLDLKNLLRTWA